jgi:hypothetical protein
VLEAFDVAQRKLRRTKELSPFLLTWHGAEPVRHEFADVPVAECVEHARRLVAGLGPEVRYCVLVWSGRLSYGKRPPRAVFALMHERDLPHGELFTKPYRVRRTATGHRVEMELGSRPNPPSVPIF